MAITVPEAEPVQQEWGKWLANAPSQPPVSLNGSYSQEGQHPQSQIASDWPASENVESEPVSTVIVSGVEYTVVRELGRGGMGIVYLVHDASLKRSVALKKLKQSNIEVLRRRFNREVQIAGQLSHPNITPVYTRGTLPDGSPSFLMPIVGRKTLGTQLQNRDPEKAPDDLCHLVDVFLKVCDAVAYAHSRGVIHRDIKPGNILIGQYGEVQLVDWGLAFVKKTTTTDANKLLASEPGRVSSPSLIEPGMTIVGDVIGTPAYMPPEQALRQSDVTEQSDVFMLGGVLYTILTGRHPNEGRTVMDCLRFAREGRRRPTFEQARWPIPRPLAEVCDKALSRLPAYRHSSARELAQAVIRARMNHMRGTTTRVVFGLVVGGISLGLSAIRLIDTLSQHSGVDWIFWASFVCVSAGLLAGSALEAIHSPAPVFGTGRSTQSD
jgi:serine/threonine protein kinase